MELLAIIIDKHLIFRKHIESLCRNAHYKLLAMRRIKKIFHSRNSEIGEALIDNWFSYVLLV